MTSKLRPEGRVGGEEGKEGDECSWSRREGLQRTAFRGMSLRSQLSHGKEVGPSPMVTEKPLNASEDGRSSQVATSEGMFVPL